ncbi:MAG: type I-U CRISPR-associated protein Cas5/Cas6 [Betaproteobacteria bacterium]|nr:type I-U CRISPR-associated protein Cas5/Cas6 [Betaproteobacteria bacterium]
MFSLGIRYLMGWSMAAADGARKEQAEWPPHPDRVFMALAAAWFETGQEAAEGKALGWLETLSPPGMCVSDKLSHRIVTHFVPVNDDSAPIKWDAQAKKWQFRQVSGDLPIGRNRQPRGFPIAIPYDPDVYLIWNEDVPPAHREPLAALCRKVGAIGHSASLVQMWVEDRPPPPTLIPISGVAPLRLRVTGSGRLAELERRMNRRACIEYRDLLGDIDQAKQDRRAMPNPPRFRWDAFPEVVLLAGESETRGHPAYRAAKAGDAEAATWLVQQLVDEAGLGRIRNLLASISAPAELALVSAHAYEREGVNAIPAALAEFLSERLGVRYEPGMVQINVVSHTGADGYGRLARQALFDGPVQPERCYVMVDDFVGQGGTLANLRGRILKNGARVAGAVCLTGKPYSAKLALDQEQLDELRNRHGKPLEKWWKEHFGHAFDCLTQSEARYLARSPDADEIRNRIASAKRVGGGPDRARSAREQDQYIAQLESQRAERFPQGAPVSLRPEPALWLGYGPASPAVEAPIPGSHFDPRLLVVSLAGKRLALPATLKITEALRGALLKACPEPIPEWVSGHDADGRASRQPHVAITPLPFVDAEHADGRIMGVGLALPKTIDPGEAAQVLEPWLRDDDGLPRRLTLFDAQWLECGAELEVRERPPINLRPETWTGPATRWASVTPVVLDRHFDGPDKWEQAAESVKTACERIGLPRPLDVLLHPVSLIRGVPRSNEFPWITRKKDGGRMHHAHAMIVFGEEVQGPVLVGAGRFRGYGLCRPLPQGGDAHA